jgi:putative endonuclease
MGRHKQYWADILASRVGGTLYTGIMSDLIRRVCEHREKLARGFTEQYGIHRFVYFEQFDDAENAICGEKRLKKWNRDWKIRLIEEANPDWINLYHQIAKA